MLGITMKPWPARALAIAGLMLYLPLASAAVKHEDATPRHKAAPPPEKQHPPMRFGEYPCPGDCSEHQAGYQWAARESISDPDDCTGSTAAFIEGCRVYAQHQPATTAGG